ncbi:MAG: cysteine desulfurase NifS [Ruminococcus sp.]|nr:cysteine desulfurase NifS [Candidatus Apopatosoma intestinale]
MEKRFVYADNAATTKPDPRVIEAMMPCFSENWGNPSSLYGIGQEAKAVLNGAREKIASLMGCDAGEIFFTSCGTESDNWAIRGAALAGVKKGKHLITSKVEHHAVLHTMASLEREGFEVTYLDVDEFGRVSADAVRAAIRPDTTLVTVMFANNEIGTIMPIREIAEVCHEKGVVFFTDAVQAVGHVNMNLHELGVDMLSCSGHKINAPKGTGFLYIKKGTRVLNLIEGGGQERGKRSGTENVAYAVALAKALELALASIDDLKRVEAMRNRLMDEILRRVPYSRLNGPREGRLPGNLNISFEYIEGESMTLLLDSCGISASTGSACSNNSLEPSHVLLAIGLPHEKAHGSLRLSLSHENTDEDVSYILENLPPIVQRLRDMSPLYHEGMERIKED